MNKLNFIEVNDVNDNKVLELLLVNDPSLVFVYGSNIIKAELLDIDALWLNAHGGILPGYRGLDSNLWAIAENKLDKVGVTVHVVNSRVDAGDIIWTEGVEVKSILSLFGIRLKIAQIMAFKFIYFLTFDSCNISKVAYRHNVKESTYKSSIDARALVKVLANLLNRKEQA
jgi:methionyl-tRNA formyltransferase